MAGRAKSTNPPPKKGRKRAGKPESFSTRAQSKGALPSGYGKEGGRSGGPERGGGRREKPGAGKGGCPGAGQGLDVERPPKGTVLDKPNSNCHKRRATVGEGQLFLQYDQSAHRPLLNPPQEAGDKGRPEEPPGIPRGGGQEDYPAKRMRLSNDQY